MKYCVEIGCYVSKIVEVEADSLDDVESVVLYDTDGNYDGIDFDQVEATDFEVLCVVEETT